jgi:hypothetical protein
MGDYTEIFFRSDLRRDVPEDVVNALMCLVGDIDEDTALSAHPLPDHEFFAKRRWSMVGRGGSAYFPVTANRLTQDEYDGTWSIFILANLKNYGGEIESFFDWIEPYCGESQGQFFGYELYEGNDVPDVYVKVSPYKPVDLEQAKFWKDSVKKDIAF